MCIGERGAQSNSLGRAWEVSTRSRSSWVAPRDRACARRDRTGVGAFALPRLGNLLLRSDARSGPIPLQLGCLGGAWGEELLRNGAGLVRDRLFGERVGNETLGGVLRLGGGSAG